MTDNNHDDEAVEVEWILNRIATVNKHMADAAGGATRLVDGHGQASTLWGTHDSLTDAYSELVGTIKTVEATLDKLDADYADPTPRQITEEHATRLREQYDGPVQYLALMLLESNRREWLHVKSETNGADEVRRHGLVTNQRRFLNQLQDAWDAYESEDTHEEADTDD